MRSRRATYLGLCGPRRLVSTLASDSGRQTKLPQHRGPVPEPLPTNESRGYPLNHHRRIPVLRESHWENIWASVCLRSSDQDAPERSGGQSRAKGHDRSWTIETSSTGLGGFRETEHLVCRTAQSHHPARLGLFGSPNTRSGSMEAMSRRSSGVTPLPLQSCFILPHLAMSLISRAIVGQDPVPQGWVGLEWVP